MRNEISFCCKYKNNICFIFSAQSKHTWTSLLNEVYAQEGVRGLYRGITMNLIKVAPAVSISYIVYEHFRNSLGVKMT